MWGAALYFRATKDRLSHYRGLVHPIASVQYLTPAEVSYSESLNGDRSYTCHTNIESASICVRNFSSCNWDALGPRIVLVSSNAGLEPKKYIAAVYSLSPSLS